MKINKEGEYSVPSLDVSDRSLPLCGSSDSGSGCLTGTWPEQKPNHKNHISKTHLPSALFYYCKTPRLSWGFTSTISQPSPLSGSCSENRCSYQENLNEDKKKKTQLRNQLICYVMFYHKTKTHKWIQSQLSELTTDIIVDFSCIMQQPELLSAHYSPGFSIG